MTRDEYKALRRAENEILLEIVHALDAAGVDGWDMMRAFQSKEIAQQAAWMQLGYEDRVALVAEDKAETDALIAKYNTAKA